MNNEGLHAEALMCAERYLECEKSLFQILLEVERRQAYRDLQLKGLFRYARAHLGLSESVAEMFRCVVNHALKNSELRASLEDDKISVVYASKIVACLTDENSKEVLEYASEHTLAETENWLVSEKNIIRTVKITVDSEVRELLRASKTFRAGNPSDKDILKELLQKDLAERDPVQQAKRAEAKTQNRKAKNTADVESSIGSGVATPKRKILTAAEKRAVDLRDERRCAFVGDDGKCCGCRKWIHRHHIQTVFDGGSNEVGNLITLCSEHHDLVHTFCVPEAIQRAWIPAPYMEKP